MASRESWLARWLDREIARAQSPRGAAVVIATATTVMTVAAGLLMTVLDHKNFTTLGQGLWWSVQTVTTVGYGDHVPSNAAGRLLAAAVMLFGIGFLTVITAAITSSFVARARSDLRRGDAAPATEQQAQDILARLDRIEAALKPKP